MWSQRWKKGSGEGGGADGVLVLFTGNYERYKPEGIESFQPEWSHWPNSFFLVWVVSRVFLFSSKSPWTRLLVQTGWYRLLSPCPSQLSISHGKNTTGNQRKLWNAKDEGELTPGLTDLETHDLTEEGSYGQIFQTPNLAAKGSLGRFLSSVIWREMKRSHCEQTYLSWMAEKCFKQEEMMKEGILEHQ